MAVGAPDAIEGLSPRCAGEPLAPLRHLPMDGVYPRVCGGAGSCARKVSRIPGLSPRVRGSRERQPEAGRYEGSIPACAGEPFTL